VEVHGADGVWAKVPAGMLALGALGGRRGAR